MATATSSRSLLPKRSFDCARTWARARLETSIDPPDRESGSKTHTYGINLYEKARRITDASDEHRKVEPRWERAGSATRSARWDTPFGWNRRGDSCPAR